jgi:hypothetical protein
MIQELDRIVLTKDLDEIGLEAGDVGTVVTVHDGGRGYDVEFVTLTGDTDVVTTVTADQVRPIDRHEIAHARPIAAA